MSLMTFALCLLFRQIPAENIRCIAARSSASSTIWLIMPNMRIISLIEQERHGLNTFGKVLLYRQV